MEPEHIEKYQESLWELEKKFNSRTRLESALKLYIFFGALVALFSIAYFFLTFLNIELSDEQILPLSMAGVGSALSIASWAFLSFWKQKRMEEEKHTLAIHNLATIVFLWAELEEVGKNALNELNVKYNTRSARQMLYGLEKYELINNKDRRLIEDAMQIRNAVAHGKIGYNAETTSNTLAIIANAIKKIELNIKARAVEPM